MTGPTPYTADELADLHRALDDGDVHPWDLTDDDFRRVLATAERAEKSKAALVAKVKRLEDRLAVAPTGDDEPPTPKLDKPLTEPSRDALDNISSARERGVTHYAPQLRSDRPDDYNSVPLWAGDPTTGD